MQLPLKSHCKILRAAPDRLKTVILEAYFVESLVMPDIPDIAHELDARAGSLMLLAEQTASESMRAEYLKIADMYRKLASAERNLASQRSMASASRHRR